MQIVAWVASVFVFFSFFMKTMIPLRIIAIVSNVTFIGYALLGIPLGVFDKVYPILVLHALLLPLNILRLRQMKELIRKVHEADAGDASIDYLIPYMKKKELPKDEVLFRKNDPSDLVFFIQKGRIYLPEFDKHLEPGSVLGEVGLFAPGNVRTATAICAEDCVIYQVHREKVLELYYQNPKFGFFLIQQMSRLVQENAQARIAQAEAQ
jgi:hypothetical protein